MVTEPITREEVNRLLDRGFFGEHRFELMDGKFINKRGQSPRHAWAIHQLRCQLMSVFGIDRVGTQFPIEAGPKDQEWCQPEPDVQVYRSARDFRDRNPFGHELSLAVEVADKTLAWDAGRKRDIYAHAGIPEYWVLDLDGRQVLVFRNLQNDAYTESLTLSETDALPHIGKPIAELL